MRLNSESGYLDSDLPNAGSLLIAHPSLMDPNFKRSVVFLTAHSSEAGSLGVVVNRSLGKTLGEFDPGLAETSLAEVPLFEGGPVSSDKLILAAWKWAPELETFRFYFGIDGDRANAILQEDPDFQIIGFLGHSGWGEGQLDEELEQGAWIISRRLNTLQEAEGEAVWRKILVLENPALQLLADAPDPSLN